MSVVEDFPPSNHRVFSIIERKIERCHRSLHSIMAKVVGIKQKKWVEFLPFVTAAYNSTVHGSASFSPNFLQFSRELISSVDIAFGCPRPLSCTPNDYAFHVRERMAEAYALVRIHMQQCAQVNKQAYDCRVNPVSFQSGDLVWYFCPRTPLGTSPKWTRHFSGPFRVVRKINDVNYVIRASAKSKLKVVHVNKLRLYKEFQLA